jgi:hypothetical protein
MTSARLAIRSPPFPPPGPAGVIDKGERPRIVAIREHFLDGFSLRPRSAKFGVTQKLQMPTQIPWSNKYSYLERNLEQVFTERC